MTTTTIRVLWLLATVPEMSVTAVTFYQAILDLRAQRRSNENGIIREEARAGVTFELLRLFKHLFILLFIVSLLPYVQIIRDVGLIRPICLSVGIVILLGWTLSVNSILSLRTRRRVARLARLESSRTHT